MRTPAKERLYEIITNLYYIMKKKEFQNIYSHFHIEGVQKYLEKEYQINQKIIALEKYTYVADGYLGILIQKEYHEVDRKDIIEKINIKKLKVAIQYSDNSTIRFRKQSSHSQHYSILLCNTE